MVLSDLVQYWPDDDDGCRPGTDPPQPGEHDDPGRPTEGATVGPDGRPDRHQGPHQPPVNAAPRLQALHGHRQGEDPISGLRWIRNL